MGSIKLVLVTAMVLQDAKDPGFNAKPKLNGMKQKIAKLTRAFKMKLQVATGEVTMFLPFSRQRKIRHTTNKGRRSN